MNERELRVALSVAAEQQARGEVFDEKSIALATKVIAPTYYGGVDALGDENLASVLRRHGTRHDRVETALAALKIEPGLGRSPMTPKRPSAWVPRRPVVVRVGGRRRRGLKIVAAAAVVFLVSLWGFGGFSPAFNQTAVASSFDELVEELTPSSSNAVTPQDPKPETTLTHIASALSNFAGDFAKGYRRCSSRLKGDPEQVTKALESFAASEKIVIQRVCPPSTGDRMTLVGDYRWPRKVRLCPTLAGIEATTITAHELAHHLQAVRGRLGRKQKEAEADAVALVALKALGVSIKATDGPYLAKSGNHLPALLESRTAIEAMATTLVQAVGGAP